MISVSKKKKPNTVHYVIINFNVLLVQSRLLHYVVFCRETLRLANCCLRNTVRLRQAVVIHHAPFSVTVCATQARYSCLLYICHIEFSLEIKALVPIVQPAGCFFFS